MKIPNPCTAGGGCATRAWIIIRNFCNFRALCGNFMRRITMTAGMKSKLFSAIAVLVCILALLQYGTRLENSEFSGGRITGVLLNLYDAGLYFFMATLVVISIWPRVAALAGLAATLLCLPVFCTTLFRGCFDEYFPVSIQFL
jgi:hypothetical protein